MRAFYPQRAAREYVCVRRNGSESQRERKDERGRGKRWFSARDWEKKAKSFSIFRILNNKPGTCESGSIVSALYESNNMRDMLVFSSSALCTRYFSHFLYVFK